MHLNLNTNEIDDKWMHQLLKNMHKKKKQKLKVLQLANNRLTSNASAVLPAVVYSDVFQLQALNLANNNIGNKGVEVMMAGIAHKNCLEYLDLSNNELGDTGLQAICENL